MKRSGIQPGTARLARGAGLSRGQGLARGKPMERGAGPIARQPMKRPDPATAPRPKPAARTGAAPGVRAAVIARDRGLCARCGRPGSNVQHREGRGAGGRGAADRARTNGPEWLVVLCGQGNTSGCHQWCDVERAQAEADGLVIRRNGPVVDAATVPVRTFEGWALLTADGRRVPVG